MPTVVNPLVGIGRLGASLVLGGGVSPSGGSNGPSLGGGLILVTAHTNLIHFYVYEPTGLQDRTGYLFGGEGQQNQFTLVRNQRGSGTIQLEILRNQTYEPQIGWPIYLYQQSNTQGDLCVFSGTIQTRNLTWQAKAGDRRWTLSVASLESVFDGIRIFPPRSYFNQKAGDIFQDLFAFASPGPVVGMGTVQPGPTIDAIEFKADQSIADAFDALATTAGYQWYVNPSDQLVYFTPQSLTAAPFPVATADMLYETIEQGAAGYEQDAGDYRNRQIVQISWNAFNSANRVFFGDGVTKIFFLPYPLEEVLSAIQTTSTQSQATAVFTGMPAVGDGFSINTAPYQFVDVLDNTRLDVVQVLRGGSMSSAIQNAVDAINSNPLQAGLTFSLPAWANDACYASDPTGNGFIAYVKWPGAGGNGVPVTGGAVIGWVDSLGNPVTMTVEGVDGISTTLNVGTLGSEVGQDLYYQAGSDTLTLAAPLPAAQRLSVSYHRMGADCIAVEDTPAVMVRAGIEHSSGRHQAFLSDTQNASARSGLLEAQTALTAYSTFPSQFPFVTTKLGLLPGQLLSITMTDPQFAPALINGNRVVQQLDAVLVPRGKKLSYCKFTVTVIDAQRISTGIDLMNRLAKVNPPTPGRPTKSQPTLWAPRFILPGILAPASNVSTNNARVQPKLGRTISLTQFKWTLKTAGAFSFEWLVNGASLTDVPLSVSGTDGIVTPAPPSSPASPRWVTQTIKVDDLMQINIISADGTAADLEIMLIGGLA